MVWSGVPSVSPVAAVQLCMNTCIVLGSGTGTESPMSQETAPAKPAIVAVGYQLQTHFLLHVNLLEKSRGFILLDCNIPYVVLPGFIQLQNSPH